jgi:hypothetical protein
MAKLLTILFELGWKLRLILTTPIGSVSGSKSWMSQDIFINHNSAPKFHYNDNSLTDFTSYDQIKIHDSLGEMTTNPINSWCISNIYHDNHTSLH